MNVPEKQIRNFKKVVLMVAAAATLGLMSGCAMYVPDYPQGPCGSYGYGYGWYYPFDALFYPIVFVDGDHGHHGGGYRHGHGGGGHRR